MNWILCHLVFGLFRFLYEPRVRGLENIPREGGALLAVNHTSFLDALLLMAVIDRPVRFLMARKMFEKWWIRPFAKAAGAIPFDRVSSPREMVEAFREARSWIEQGGIAGIFPEGEISLTGNVLRFRQGYNRVVRDLDVPIIPIAVDGAAETRYGFVEGVIPRTRRPGAGRRTPLHVVIGEPQPATIEPESLRQAVSELLVDAFAMRKGEVDLLHRQGIRDLRRMWRKRQFADHGSQGPIPNYRLLAAIVALGGKLAPRVGNDEHVGVMLPPSLGGLIVNFYLMAAGRVSVNLNYTASTKILEEIRDETGLRVLITSRVLLEKAPVKVPSGIEIVYLEDIRHEIGALDRLRALAAGLFAPIPKLERQLGRRSRLSLDDTITILFSSGSTGTPKGIPLTHWNIISNVRGTLLAVRLRENSRLLGVLPFFHSFGYTVALWLPLQSGIGVTYFPNPLDPRGVAEIAVRDGCTCLFGTPTFLAQYIRRLEGWQLGGLEFILTGAEKLRATTADGFEARFGLRPVEGYGCTETSPVVALSARNVRRTGMFQRAEKPGSVGVPIPGVAVRIVDPDTGEPVPPGQPGMMMVRGGNVMHGYFKRPELTEQVLQDGWYRTGDIAYVDEDGFVFITDRLSRFSKIAGEMIPHGRVEEALQHAAGESETVFAVTGLPDEKRGERLAVLHSLPEDKARAALTALESGDSGLPRLWVPRWQDFVRVAEIPVLASGKKDLKRIKDIAREKLES